MWHWDSDDWFRALVLLVPTFFIGFKMGTHFENTSIHDSCVKAGAFMASRSSAQPSQGFSCEPIQPTLPRSVHP